MDKDRQTDEEEVLTITRERRRSLEDVRVVRKQTRDRGNDKTWIIDSPLSCSDG